MITLMLGIFVKFLEKEYPEWIQLRDQQTWSQWEEYEQMRKEMGVTVTTTPIPKKNWKKINPRKKHGV